jgi:hypothetical protein
VDRSAVVLLVMARDGDHNKCSWSGVFSAPAKNMVSKIT